jgi:hypothetical protein
MRNYVGLDVSLKTTSICIQQLPLKAGAKKNAASPQA